MSGKVHIAILAAGLALGAGVFDKAVDSAAGNPHLLYAAAQYEIFIGDAESALRLLQQAEAKCSGPRILPPAPAETHARSLCPNAPKG